MLFCLASSPYIIFNLSSRRTPIVEPYGTISSSSTMGFLLIHQNARDLWKEWELRFLVLLSLFLQLTLATQASRRKSIFRVWIRVVVWMMYLLADSIATLTLGVMSNRLANIKEMKGTIDPRSQVIAFWAPFLLLHLGGPDTITAYALEDNELWLRHLARLCVQVGIAGHIYFMALAGSPLSILAAGVVLVGFIKYAERTLCLYLASEGRLRDSMLPLPNFGSLDPRITEQNLLSKAYELFKIFKLLFVGLIVNIVNVNPNMNMFMDPDEMNSVKAFHIVEIELGFMYDLLYTKVPLLNCAWGIIRWVMSLSVPCVVLVFFSLQDKKDYPKVDIWITFLLMSVAILLEIYSLLLAISSDWFVQWWLGRFAISFTMALPQFCLNRRWSNSVAQLSLFKLSFGKINRIFLKYPWLFKLDEKSAIFYINYKEFGINIKDWIFPYLRDTVKILEWNSRLKNGEASLKPEVGEVLNRSNYEDLFRCVIEVLKRLDYEDLVWSVQAEFDKIILIWHVATEVCYYGDHDKKRGITAQKLTIYRMSKLISRYMLYLLQLHPSMLPTGIGVRQYKDALVDPLKSLEVDTRKFFDARLEGMPKNEGSISSVVIKWVNKLFKKERHIHTSVKSCEEWHKSGESRDLCELYYIMLKVGTQLPTEKIGGGERRSAMFDACRLASQLNNIEDFGKKWDLIGKVWAQLLIYAAYRCKGLEHCEGLSRGGELLSHIWLLMAHLGVAEALQAFDPECVAKLNRQ
ncbi:hypothetical protein BT93_C1040 [Corymbia citriodora subsp. variegata]|nr:hypothetical protein BT93_C1040 [Corymbia citriodora subsp. variegata]